jgi:hypothetical protein
VDIDRTVIDETKYYFADPRKVLDEFVSRNEVEKSISYKQIGGKYSEFIATLEINGLQGPFNATGKGKKKQLAERDACLEACYKLDKLEILESDSAGQSYQQRSKRLLELIGDDEDDNSYLDRTTSVKKAKTVEPVVETFESLSKKLQDKINEKIALEGALAEQGMWQSNQ